MDVRNLGSPFFVMKGEVTENCGEDSYTLAAWRISFIIRVCLTDAAAWGPERMRSSTGTLVHGQPPGLPA